MSKSKESSINNTTHEFGVIPRALLWNHTLSCEEKMVLCVLTYGLNKVPEENQLCAEQKITMNRLSLLSSVKIETCRDIIKRLISKDIIEDTNDMVRSYEKWGAGEISYIIYSLGSKIFTEYMNYFDDFPVIHKTGDEGMYE